MDERRVETLTDDALDREVTAALAADPSPEFLARVRGRVAQESVRSAWWPRWTMAAAASLAAVGVIAIVVTWNARQIDRPATTTTAALTPSEQLTPPLPESSEARVGTDDAGRQVDRAAVDRALIERGAADVVVLAAQQQAVRLLVAAARDGEIVTPAETVPSELNAVEPIELPSITLGRVDMNPVLFELETFKAEGELQ